MSPDLDILGVYVPVLLPVMLGCYLVFLALRRLLRAAGLYRIVWHPALFDIALYVTLLGVAVPLLEHVPS